MARVFDRYLRLEPRRPLGDLAAGLRMEAHDPAWILGRQWRMGEHQGENASSPVQVALRVRETALKALEGRDGIDLGRTPPEAAIEREGDDWWTPGRRVLYGRRAAGALPALDAADPTLLLADLPVPYDALNGRSCPSASSCGCGRRRPAATCGGRCCASSGGCCGWRRRTTRPPLRSRRRNPS